LFGLVGLMVVAAIFGFGGIALQFAAAQEPDMPAFVPWIPAAVGLLIGFFIALFAVPCLVVAWGLFQCRPWSKIFALVLGIVNLISFPLGTATGVYAIWFYTQPDAFVTTSG
jgi:hypothetical protein